MASGDAASDWAGWMAVAAVEAPPRSSRMSAAELHRFTFPCESFFFLRVPGFGRFRFEVGFFVVFSQGRWRGRWIT